MSGADSNHPVIGAVASYSLAQLNDFIGQEEDELGPLEKIGNDGKQTALQFDMTVKPPKEQTPPLKNAAITPTVGGKPVLPPGTTQISQGKVFIVGQLTDAVAYRPK